MWIAENTQNYQLKAPLGGFETKASQTGILLEPTLVGHMVNAHCCQAAGRLLEF